MDHLKKSLDQKKISRIRFFPLYGNGDTIRIGREIQCLPYAGYLPSRFQISNLICQSWSVLHLCRFAKILRKTFENQLFGVLNRPIIKEKKLKENKYTALDDRGIH